LNWYAPLLGPPVNKSIAITLPLCFDQYNGVTGQTFDAYLANLRPVILLIDQTGIIRLRYDGASTLELFNPHLDEIKTTITDLLENPPQG